MLFLTGMRTGEAAALRWRAYDAAVEPLGRLLVATSFNRKKRVEKAVKTESPGKYLSTPPSPKSSRRGSSVDGSA